MKKILVVFSVAVALLMTSVSVRADDSDWLEELMKTISDVSVASTVTNVVSRAAAEKQEEAREKQKAKAKRKSAKKQKKILVDNLMKDAADKTPLLKLKIKSFKRACSVIIEDYFYDDFDADEVPCGCLDTCFDVAETRHEDELCNEFKDECMRSSDAENTKTKTKYGSLNDKFYGNPSEDGSRFVDDSDDDDRAEVLGASFSGIQFSDFVDRPGLIGSGNGISTIADRIEKKKKEIECLADVKDLFHGFLDPEDVPCDCYDICVDKAGDNDLRLRKCGMVDLTCSE